MAHDRPWLRGALLVATVALVSVAAGAAVVSAQDTPIDPAEAARAAAAPKPFTAPDYPANVDVTGCVVPEATWTPTQAERQDWDNLQVFLSERFGGRGGNVDELKRGVIGLAADGGQRRGYVVVVDPTVVDLDGLQRGLINLKTSSGTRIQTSCYSSAALRATLDEVQAIAKAYRSSYGLTIDSDTSKVDVRMRAEFEAALAIAERLGERVSVTEGTDSPAD